MSDKYSIAYRHPNGNSKLLLSEDSGKVYIARGWYTERQLLYVLRELHAANNPKPQLVEAWRESELVQPACPVEPCEELAVVEPSAGTPETSFACEETEPLFFDRLVSFIVKTRDQLWTAVLKKF